MEIMEGTTDKISIITKRDLERKLELQKRKDNKNLLSAENEKLGFFEETFTNKKTYIQNQLALSHELEKTRLPEHFNEISKEILMLQKYVANSNLFLRTYDVKKCHEILQELTIKQKDLENELLPKKKFGFKNKTKPKCDKQPSDKDEVDFQKKTILVAKQICGFTNKKDAVLEISGDEIFKNDVTAENLENCKVKIFGSPSTLHLNYLKNCQIFTGPVSTSIFAENCVNCTLVIACQQLRLHASQSINIYLHVTSRAIMEDCSQIYLAPYNLDYPGIENDFQKAGLDKKINNWTSVDDFNWLNLEKQSPNWALLEENKIVHNWDL